MGVLCFFICDNIIMAGVQYVFGIVVSLFLFILLIVLIYLTVSRMYSPTQVGTKLIDKPVEMSKNMTTCSGKLLTSGTEHTYSFWFFVSQWELGTGNKQIFTRSHRHNKLKVFLDSNHPNMTMEIVDKNGNLVQPFHNSDDPHPDGKFMLRDIRIQGWNHISICIWDKVMDIYMNGKLTRSFLLPVTLLSDENNGIVVGGTDDVNTFNGFMSRFIYFPRVLSPREIYNTYLKGPAKSNLLSKDAGTKMGTEFVFGGDNTPDCGRAV